MDGYAVGRDDLSDTFKVVAEVRTGEQPVFTLAKGECARVFTGAQLPNGASQVIMQEDVERDGETIVVKRRSDATHIRARGEDARAGTALLQAGTRLRAPEAALLAQLGVAQPVVSPAPRVIHFVTGDELVPPTGVPGPGQIRDSNSTLIASLLTEAGARLSHQRNCGDNLAALVRDVRTVPEAAWDLLLISGGASVGDYDFGEGALEKLGFNVHFRQLNLRPGKPLIFATRGRQAAFVIPGNPVSHFVTFHVAIRLALERLEAAAGSWPLADVQLAGELLAEPNPRETFWPARAFTSAGELHVAPLAWRSSGDVCGLVSTNALIHLPAGEIPPRDGLVKCLLLDLR
jgi:molybdopterin molybdotransferase